MTNRCARGMDIDMPVMVNYDIPVDAQNRADCETYLRRCVPAFVTGMQFTWYNLSPLSLLTPHPPYPSPSSPLFLLTLSLLTLSLLTLSLLTPSPSSPPLPPHPLSAHPLFLLTLSLLTPSPSSTRTSCTGLTINFVDSAHSRHLQEIEQHFRRGIPKLDVNDPDLLEQAIAC